MFSTERKTRRTEGATDKAKTQCLRCSTADRGIITWEDTQTTE